MDTTLVPSELDPDFYFVVVPVPDIQTKRSTTTILGRLYDTDSYNVKSTRKRPQYDITNEYLRSIGQKPKPTPEHAKCNWCHRAWTILPYYDQWGGEVNLSIDDAIRDLTAKLDRRRLQLCVPCFSELEERRKAAQ